MGSQERPLRIHQCPSGSIKAPGDPLRPPKGLQGPSESINAPQDPSRPPWIQQGPSGSGYQGPAGWRKVGHLWVSFGSGTDPTFESEAENIHHLAQNTWHWKEESCIGQQTSLLWVCTSKEKRKLKRRRKNKRI